MNQHYTNCLDYLNHHSELLIIAHEHMKDGLNDPYERTMEMCRQTLQRAQVEATLATLTAGQISG